MVYVDVKVRKQTEETYDMPIKQKKKPITEQIILEFSQKFRKLVNSFIF